MSSKNNNVIIGNAQLIYSEEGKLKQGYFTPTMKVDLDDKTIEELYKIPCSDDSNDIKDKAETIMAAWFNQMTEIELADRTKYKIVGRTTECVMYPGSKKVKSCTIEFSLQSII